MICPLCLRKLDRTQPEFPVCESCYRELFEMDSDERMSICLDLYRSIAVNRQADQTGQLARAVGDLVKLTDEFREGGQGGPLGGLFGRN